MRILLKQIEELENIFDILGAKVVSMRKKVSCLDKDTERLRTHYLKEKDILRSLKVVQNIKSRAELLVRSANEIEDLIKAYSDHYSMSLKTAPVAEDGAKERTKEQITKAIEAKASKLQGGM